MSHENEMSPEITKETKKKRKKKEVATRPVDKKVFMKVVSAKGTSIRVLGNVDQTQISASDKTIRRALNKGRMRPIYVDEIAKYLDVDPRVLTGDIYKEYSFFSFDPLEHLTLYPYSREQEDKYRIESSREIVSRILSTFNRSYVQLESLDLLKQYEFQEELFEALADIVIKHFPQNLFGQKGSNEDLAILFDLANERDEEISLRDADTVTRKEFIDNPPIGYTPEQIIKMTREQIYSLKENELTKEWFTKKSSLEEEYEKKFTQKPKN